MLRSRPYRVFAYHSCDKKLGIRVLNGQETLKHSSNAWDWLGHGIYFWEENPYRALSYATEVRDKKQFNKLPINIPFVLGAVIDLEYCLNLTETESLEILPPAFDGFKKAMELAGEPLPTNKEANRQLDCAVIEYIHQSNKLEKKPPFQTVRGSFYEGKPVYEGTEITIRNHIQICVRDEDCIRGFFLPKPIQDLNPYL